MRIALGKLLLQKPKLLLLDEPTNHLDLEARNWLEEYLTTYPLRSSLFRMTAIFWISRWNASWRSGTSRCISMPGTTTNICRAKRRERNSWRLPTRRRADDRIEQLEVFINRFRYTATKAKQVQSRIKELEKMERIQIPEEEKTVHFSFPQPKPSGRIVAEFAGVAKSYGDHKVFETQFMIERGERIALVGVNGAGKSTLIKLLAQQEKLSAGEYKLGHEVHPDYFAQDQYGTGSGSAHS